VPSLATLIYLYSTTVPGASPIVTAHSGFAVVYWEAESATALPVAQLPSAETEPTILMVWPTTVVASSLKVTATEVGVVQAADVVVVVVVLPSKWG
jgi:hypothetical protein